MRLSATLVFLLFVPLAASAASLPVSYTVDEKALKEAIAGTNVTFDVYTDSACTGPVAHTQTLAIEDVELISRLKLRATKGATEKPPKTIELRHTLAEVTTTGNVFLKVTGTGVTPVGGDCQAQGAQVAPAVVEGLKRSVSWQATLTSADETIFAPHVYRTTNTNTQFQAGSRVSAVSAFISGDLSSCANWAATVILPEDQTVGPPPAWVEFGFQPGAVLNAFPAVSGLDSPEFVQPFAQGLSVFVYCYNGSFTGDVQVDVTLDVVDIPATID